MGALVGLGLFLVQHARLRRALAHKKAVTEGPLLRTLRRQVGDQTPSVRLWSSAHISSPLVRVAVRKLRQGAELLCDERALASTGDGLALARCLATVAERFGGPALPAWSAAMAATPSELLVRVERVLGEPPLAPRRIRVALTVALEPRQGFVYDDVVPALDACVSAGFTHIDFVGTSGDAIRAQVVRDESRGVTSVFPMRDATEVAHASRDSSTSRASIFACADKSEQQTRERELSEIEKTNESLDFIKQAELYSPRSAPNARGAERGASVSMVVKTKGGRVLTQAEAQALTLLLENSLGSSADKLVITDQAGRLIRGDRLGLLISDTADAVSAGTNALAALGYVDEATLEVARGPIRAPAVTVAITANGALSLDGDVLVPGDSKDDAPHSEPMAARSEGLLQLLGVASDGVAVIEEPLCLSAPDAAPFSQVLQVIAQGGRREVLMPNVQLDLQLHGGERRLFSIVLPSEADVPSEAVDDGSGAARAQPPQPKVTIRVEGPAWTMSSTTIEGRNVRTMSPHTSYREGFAKAVSAINATAPGLQIVFETRPGTTEGDAAELLDM